MRIAQIAPLFESVPPRLYGGTERVVSYLTEELVRLGHNVTLFASRDSETRGRLVAGSWRALWRDACVRETLPHHVRQLAAVFRDVGTFDVLHFHGDYLHLPLLRFHRHRCAAVTTMHGALHAYDLAPLFDEYRDAALVSISDDQRRPLPRANWCGTVPHGLPLDLLAPRADGAPGGGYLAFLGRLSPEKRVDRAIEIACRSGVPLKIAAKIYPEEQGYFDATIAPLLRAHARLVEFVGEIGGRDKEAFLGGARALVFPIDWPEPFGLVMIEALACGTPVIAWRRGSVPEVITDGLTGFIVDTVDDAVRAVQRLDGIDRQTCRRVFEERFGVTRMAQRYLRIYQQLAERPA